MIVSCPWCGIAAEIVAMNCGIFVCCERKDGGPVNPHDEVSARNLVAAGQAWGCGRQFQWVNGIVQQCTGR